MSQNFSIETKIETLFLISYFSLSKKWNGTLGTRISHFSYCPLIWLFHSRNMKHYMKRIHESMVAHLVQNSFKEKCYYSEKHFSIQRKFYHIQRNIFIFSGSFIFSEFLCISKKFHIQRNVIMFSDFFCYIQINFSYSEKNLYLKKLFIFR